ncbi:hypothetical protein C2G38_2212298 [Gigaspora rosea]|uniref:Uncharacterized protein n=1 Tax=Gigaspora rosea TaxID=44941 RepID=A0A397UDD3_9GLOM|nr:hypothetical protein C2G38_2212298 [Gigaspora rosea]
MLSIWETEIVMNKAMASSTEPSMHPLFIHKHSSKTKNQTLSPITIQQSNSIQQSNLMQAISI